MDRFLRPPLGWRFALIALLTLAAATAWAEIDRDLFRHQGALSTIELVVPAGWALSEQVSYPGLLMTAIHRNGPGRITLAQEIIGPAADAHAYAKKSRDVLAKLGYKVSPLVKDDDGTLLLKLTTPDGQTALRQAYRVKNGVVYILSLAAPSKRMTDYDIAFEDTLRSMRLTATLPTATHGLADAGPDTANDAPLGGSEPR